MRDGIVVQHRHGHRHSNPVVPAQGRPTGLDPVAIHVQIQRVLGEIVLHTAVLHTHHVQMPLEHHRRMALIARRRILPDHHVAQLVPAVLQPPLPGKRLRPITGSGGVPRPVGDAGELLKETQYALRLQIC